MVFYETRLQHFIKSFQIRSLSSLRDERVDNMNGCASDRVHACESATTIANRWWRKPKRVLSREKRRETDVL